MRMLPALDPRYTDTTLPTEDNGTPVFTIEYLGDDKINGRCLHRVEYLIELDAIRRIGSCFAYDNLTLVAVGPNIDQSRYAI